MPHQITTLPDEILLNIYNELPPIDKINLSQTNRKLYQVGEDNASWEDTLNQNVNTENYKQCFLKHPYTRTEKYFFSWLDREDNQQEVKKIENEFKDIIKDKLIDLISGLSTIDDYSKYCFASKHDFTAIYALICNKLRLAALKDIDDNEDIQLIKETDQSIQEIEQKLKESELTYDIDLAHKISSHLRILTELELINAQIFDKSKESSLNALVALKNKEFSNRFDIHHRYQLGRKHLIVAKFLIWLIQSDIKSPVSLRQSMSNRTIIEKIGMDHVCIAKMITINAQLRSILEVQPGTDLKEEGKVDMEALFSGCNRSEDRKQYDSLTDTELTDYYVHTQLWPLAKIMRAHLLKMITLNRDRDAFDLFLNFKKLYQFSQKQSSLQTALTERVNALKLG